MNEITKISIITLTYNNSDVLENAISSVNSQIVDSKYTVEYFVVDDSSLNFNREIVEKKLKSLIFQYRLIINPKNLGTVKSFNRAIRMSSGDIIIPLSADDEFYDKYVVNDIITEFLKSQELIITGLRVPVKNNKELNSLPLMKNRHLFQSRAPLLRRIASGRNFIAGASTYYHRKIFDEIGFFNQDYRLLEDCPFYFKALKSGINIHFINRKVIRYGTEGGSKIGNVSATLQDDGIKFYRYVISLGILDYWQTRFVYYSWVLKKNEQLEILNVLRYPEQFIYSCIVKVKRAVTR